jgi:hypothetical protein
LSPYSVCGIFVIGFYTFSSKLLIELLPSIEVCGNQDI